MLDSQDGPQGVFTGSYFPHNNHSCEGINTTAEEEELSVLPRHTKVIVTGNNRTKSVLVGLHGVVKKAVGLGGWHWLVLTNGVEVKLQRNALSVIEAPTGHEEDDLDIPFSNESAIDDFPRTFKPRVRPHKPPPPDVPKGADSPPASESPLSKRPTEKKMDPNCKASQNLQLTVDLSKLDTAALRRYRRHFKLFDVGPSSPKEQLLQAVSKHFVSHQPDEVEILTGFLQNVKRQRT